MDMYFLALVMPEELNKKVLICKNYMNQHYNCSVGLRSPAHITIIPPFYMEPEKEKDLVIYTEAISIQLAPFTIETNDFSAFKPKTIFIAVKANFHLMELKNKAAAIFKDTEYKIKPENRPSHPHITIATRDLYKKDFHEAWDYFQNKKFREEWQANNLSILHHNKKNWDVVYTSQFLLD